MNFSQDHPSKTAFLLKSLQNWSCDNFSHRSANVPNPWLHDYIYNIIWVIIQIMKSSRNDKYSQNTLKTPEDFLGNHIFHVL